MKRAIVHDWLVVMAGAEKVLESIYEIYPAPIYTLVKDEKALKKTVFKEAKLHSSVLQSFPFAKTKYPNYLPFFPYAIEQFDLSEYDVILSSSHAVAKSCLIHAEQLHISYCHSPMRYIWDLSHEYLARGGLSLKLLSPLVRSLLHYLRIWDVTTAGRVDHFIANSQHVAKRIRRVYGREAKVIYPPVDMDSFSLNMQRGDFFLTASRLVPYKKIDLIVESFAKLPQEKLVVIGEGAEMKKLRRKATANVELRGYQEQADLVEAMQTCRAFIFAAHEDFGIMPVEAQACGAPVIAYAKGGALETVVEGKTGLFFQEQNRHVLVKVTSERNIYH